VRRAWSRRVVTTYRAVWWTATVSVCLVGLAGGCVLLGPAAASCLAGVGAALGAATVSWGSGPAPATGRRPTLTALCGAVLPLVVVGLLAELGPVALLLCLLLAAGGWPLRRRPAVPAPRVRARLRRPAPGPPALETIPPDPLPGPHAVPGLDTATLCWVWRVSYARLARCRWPGEREHLALLRRACLDELERRDPRAFARWLSTARAAADPGRFFLGGQRQP
jgi:hypothetical protein